MVIRSITNLDLDKISNFLSIETNADVKLYKKIFGYWWFDNPAYKKGQKKGYILYDEKLDEIFGFIGLYPTYFISNKKQKIVFNLTNWRVNEKYRYYSLELLLKCLKHDNETLLFNTTPTEKVKKILEKLQFSKFPNINDKNYYLVTNTFNIIKKNTFWLPRISFTKPLFKFLDKFYFYTSIKQNLLKNSKVKLIKQLDDDFIKLWDKNFMKYGNTTDRSLISLKWYYFHEAIKEKFFLFGFYLNDSLVGFISFNKQGNHLVCIDCFCNQKDEDIVTNSMEYIYNFSRKNNFDLVIYPKFVERSDRKIQKTKLLYKHKKSEEDSRYYLFCKSHYRFDNDNSYLTFSSGDYGL